MLGPIRKFSTSIYAKILLGIVIIPFVFWGMGSSFRGGDKNIIVVIEKEKYSTQAFVDFIKKSTTNNPIVDITEPIPFNNSLIDLPYLPNKSIAVFDVQPYRNVFYKIKKILCRVFFLFYC